MMGQIGNIKNGVSNRVGSLAERVYYLREGVSARASMIMDRMDYLRGSITDRVEYIRSMSFEMVDFANVRYELNRNIERADREFTRRIHVFLLSVFIFISAIFTIQSYLDFGAMTVLYVAVVLTVAVAGENLVSKTGSYSYNMEHRPIVGRVPLFIPFLWLAMNLGSLYISYEVSHMLNVTSSLYIAMMSAMIPLFIDLLLLEPRLSRGRRVWVWRTTTRLYAPYGNYVVWFAFPFLMNLGFLMLV
jgi:hypothetical protein